MNKILWSPQPKQELALRCPSFELFFGGAAGGGKSDFMLMDFLEGANKYGKYWNGIIFRQTTNELEQLQKRAAELYPLMGAVWKGKSNGEHSNCWIFPNGATLKMRYLESDKDVGRYQGHEYTWIGIDELGNYPTPYCWTYMISRLRSVHGVPCYIRGTANPGGVGHAWIKQRFMDDHIPNQIFYRESQDFEGNTVRTSCCFIPSKLDDNQILMKADPMYSARLMNLPAHLARALRYGDWSVFEGQIFDVFRRDRHVIKPVALPPGEWFKFCCMDWGFSRPFAIYWLAVNTSGRVIIYREYYGCEKDNYNTGLKLPSSEVAETAWNMSLTEGVKDMVADPAIWNKSDDGPSIADNFSKVGWKMVRGNNDRKNGLVHFYNYLKNSYDENGTPMLQVVEHCHGFIRTIPMLQPNPNNMEDVDTNLEDHPYDAVRYGLMSQFVAHPTVALRHQNDTFEDRHETADFNPLSELPTDNNRRYWEHEGEYDPMNNI